MAREKPAKVNGNKHVSQARAEADGGDSVESGDGARETWSNPAEFVLCCLGYAVGLGNIWRFPYMCFQNGGGAFLIPYAIMLVFVGIPAFAVELIMGQYSGNGPMTVWAAAPLFQGIGVGMVFLNSLFTIFYTMILGYALYYFVVSFFNPLPWDTCQHDYNTPYCYNKGEAEPCEHANGTWFNQTCYNETYLSQFDGVIEVCNGTSCVNETYNPMESLLTNETAKVASSSEEYYNLGVVRISSGLEETGDVVWEMVVALLAAWMLCFVCLLKGIKTTGKVVYFTAIFPYVLLTILLIYSALLPGSLDGVKYYIIPDWEHLKSAKVWADAAGQIFFSLSVGGGGLMTFSSYNKFRNNIFRDWLIVSIGNCLTSFYAGFVIFSILGYMAYTLEQDVQDVATDGSTLVFVAYPQVVARMPVPQLWSVLFFIMIITLGLDSLFAGIETTITAFVDTFPALKRHKLWATLVLILVSFALGIPMCTQAGAYWLAVIAYYSTGWALILVGLLEIIVFCWIYGAKKIRLHANEMVGFDIGMHWVVAWYSITPLLLIAILVFNLYDFRPLSFGPVPLPWWGQAIGWLIALTPLGFVIIVAIYRYVHSYRLQEYRGLSACKRFVKLCQPNSMWGPSYSKALRAAANQQSDWLNTDPKLPNGETELNGGTSIQEDKSEMRDRSMSEGTKRPADPPPAYDSALAYNNQAYVESDRL